MQTPMIVLIITFIIIPSVWWRITTKGNSWFLPWIGLKRVEKSARGFWLSICIASLYILIAMATHTSVFPAMLMSGFDGGFAALDFGYILLIVVMIMVPMGLLVFATEIFFRGFLGKQLANKLGFVVGNTIQAVLYGLVFGILIIASTLDVGVVPIAAFVFLFASFGWISGYICEKRAGGSIIPACVILSVILPIHILPVYFLDLIWA